MKFSLFGPPPEEDPDRRLGAVFTPPDVAAQLVARVLEADPSALDRGRTVLDPTCGDGALLLAACRHRLASGLTSAEVAETTFGIELQARHREACVNNLVALLGEDLRPVVERNIVQGDALEILTPPGALL